MLYNLEWLNPGQSFPPQSEVARIQRCQENAKLFSNEHFGNVGPYHNVLYGACIERLCECAENSMPATAFPVVLNYQRAMSIKTADLVCGEYPSITGSTESTTDQITELRDMTDFDIKLYATVIDLSRYGDAIWRVFKNEETKKGDFTVWSPTNWFPIVQDDGTLREKAHVLAWKVNVGTEDKPIWELHAQIHYVGYYLNRVYTMDGTGAIIGPLKVDESKIATGLSMNAISHLRNLRTSDTVYGFDDYMPIDSLLSEIMTRIGQISRILDKHASPSMCGPSSMLSIDEETGQRYMKAGKFYAVGQGDSAPQYLTWNGQLDAAFKELEMLLQQLYMLSELGEALLGSMGASNGQAISGSAMRFKLANPLIKARRVSNALTLPTKKLIASISELGFTKLDVKNISIEWEDGLPEDPRENAEMAKLVTGATQLMPLSDAIMEYFDKTAKEAKDWVSRIDEEALKQIRNNLEKDPMEINPDENSTSTGGGKSGSIMNP